jgi:hypothetical protein
MPVTSEPKDHHHLSQAVPLEDVEQLMQDNADAKAYEDSLRQMLGEGVGWAAHQLQLKRLCCSRGMHGTVPAWLLAKFPHSPVHLLFVTPDVGPAWLFNTWGGAPCKPLHPSGESLNPEDAEAAEEELADLEAQLLDAQKLDMPQAPKDTVLPEAAAAVAAEEAAPALTAEEAAPAGGEQAVSALEGAAAASEADALSAAEAMLSELPAVPTTTVTVETEETEVEAEQAREAESALIAS